jgi:hypothetical protein
MPNEPIQPCFPLPWKHIPEEIDYCGDVKPDSDCIVDRAGRIVVYCQSSEGCVLSGDAEYIVHAANMFPKLVASLRYCIGESDRLNHFLDQGIGGPMTIEDEDMDLARQTLREAENPVTKENPA